MGPDGFGIHQPTLDRIAADLVAARELGVELGVVVGGGNIFRGVEVSRAGHVAPDRRHHGHARDRHELPRARSGDRAARASRRARMSALAMPEVCETYERRRALEHLAKGRIVLLAGGTGNPFFTTDTDRGAARRRNRLPRPC